MSERLDKVKIDGKDHLVKKTSWGSNDEDLGELYKKNDGSYETRNIGKENYTIKDKHSFDLLRDLEFNVNKSNGEEGEMRRNHFDGYYDYEKNDKIESQHTLENNYSPSSNNSYYESDSSFNSTQYIPTAADIESKNKLIKNLEYKMRVYLLVFISLLFVTITLLLSGGPYWMGLLCIIINLILFYEVKGKIGLLRRT